MFKKRSLYPNEKCCFLCLADQKINKMQIVQTVNTESVITINFTF